MDDDILTIKEVARYLRVSERTVYDWAQKGEIPSGKIGTVWRFKKSDIERWGKRAAFFQPPRGDSSVPFKYRISSPPTG
jgi:DNA binding domain, excisionase family